MIRKLSENLPFWIILTAILLLAFQIFDHEILYGIVWVLAHIIVLLPSVA